MKCKHKWAAVDICRESEWKVVGNGMTIAYKDWIVTFVCPKCKKLKSEVCKDLK